jgi:hypothetical protein
LIVRGSADRELLAGAQVVAIDVSLCVAAVAPDHDVAIDGWGILIARGGADCECGTRRDLGN